MKVYNNIQRAVEIEQSRAVGGIVCCWYGDAAPTNWNYCVPNLQVEKPSGTLISYVKALFRLFGNLSHLAVQICFFHGSARANGDLVCSSGLGL